MNDELRSLGSARARGIVLLLVVGIAGGAAGGAIDRWWTTRRERSGEGGYVVNVEPRRARSRTLELRSGEDEAIPFALRSVNLTPEQVERIHALSARYRPAAESLMRSVAPRVQELNSRMQKEAMCVLTPAQRTAWMAWRERERLSLEEGKQMLELANSGRCPAETKK
jgi:hypothetical protein